MSNKKLIPYILIGILWGIFAGKQQYKRTPDKFFFIFLTFIVNTMTYPMAMIIAIIKQ